MSLFARTRSLYRTIVPEKLRRFIRRRFRRGYDDAFFARLEDVQRASYDVVAESIVAALKPRFVVDVGCGAGTLLAAMNARGVRTLGLEGSAAGIARAQQHGVDVQPTDLAKPFTVPPCDVVTSFEVAEHLPETSADSFVAALAAAAPHVVFSAATPGQGGTDHINEQPHQYWIEKFRTHGFTVDEATTHKVRAHWSERGVARWYCKNVMFFTRGA